MDIMGKYLRSADPLHYRRRGSQIGLLFVLCFLLGCPTHPNPDVNRLFTLGPRFWCSELEKYSPEMRVKVYLAAMHSIRPPPWGMAVCLAQNGAPIFPHIIRELPLLSDPHDKVFLIKVLSVVPDCHFDLRLEPAAVVVIREAINSITDLFWKREAENDFEMLLKVCGLSSTDT